MAIREKKQVVRRGGVLEYENITYGMGEVGGLMTLKSWLSKRGKLFTDAARGAGIRPPRGVLLAGVPGTGKTLCARAIAAAWNQPLVRLDAGRLFGSLVGESEANLRIALRTAEAIAPCVLLVDEMEKGFGSGGGLDGGTSQRVFGALLTWMQDKRSEVFVVGTANDIDKLDAALIRRFDAVFCVDLPDTSSRAEIIGIHLRRAGHAFEGGDLSEFARLTSGFTGSELEASVQSALIDAFNDGVRKPAPADMVKAIRATVPLSKTMADRIEALRTFCKSGRAIPAGGTLEDDSVRATQPASLQL
jgi:SpoVK/Ycf46/Vps4 family AAA+-type ATPase